MIRVTFLGTAASRPTVRRNVSAIALQREGELMLFDCGEGTQRQMMRYATGFGIGSIFFTHLHADHFLGITGLLRTMALQDRTDPIDLYGPSGAAKTLSEAVTLGVERTSFTVRIHELEAGESVAREEYDIVPFDVQHGTPSLGYALKEHPRRGRFDIDKVRSLGIPEGPLYGRLHRGESVEVEGRLIAPDDLVGPPRPGRTVVYTGDTRPAPVTVEVARGAELLIHDCTFGDEEADRAWETHHTTARGAAEVAVRAGVKRLVLHHISARYSDDPSRLEREARSLFPSAIVAYDGLSMEIPYSDGEGEGLGKS